MKKLLAMLLALVLGLSMGGAALAENAGHISILLIGEDEAASESVTRGSQAWGRADAIVLATLSTATGDARLLSIDRDYLINMEGQGETKLSMANFFGGPKALLAEVNRLLDLDVSLYAMIGKQAMGGLVDKMGGVTIDIAPEDLAVTKLRQTGPQTLTGEQAIAYMARRDMDGSQGDVDRNERQRKVLSAIASQAMTDGGMTGLLALADAVLPFLDTNVSIADILRAGTALASTGIGSIQQDRSPRIEDRQRKITAAHEVTFVADMPAEVQRVQAFLYGE